MNVLAFIIRSLAVIGFSTLNAYLPEQILGMTSKEERSILLNFLPFAQNFASTIYLFIYTVLIKREKKILLDKKSFFYNIICGLLFWLSSYLGFLSVEYVSFPVKIVISASKILLAMPSSIISRGFKSPKGTIFGYSFQEIAVSFTVFLGLVTMFLPSSSSGKGLLENFSWIGVFLLVASINLSCIFDELQSSMIRGGYNQKVVLMWNTLMTSFINAIALGVRGQVVPVYHTLRSNPSLLRSVLLLALSHMATQVSIVALKSNHGIWWKNIVASLRKCISLVVSVVLFGHKITTQQTIGAVIVCACLFWAASIEMKRPAEKSSSKKDDGKKSQQKKKITPQTQKKTNQNKNKTNSQNKKGQNGQKGKQQKGKGKKSN